MSQCVFVIGVAMPKFEKPEPRGWSHPEMVVGAVDAALQDADLRYERLEAAYGAGFRRSSAARPVHRGQDRPSITTVSNACVTASSVS